MTQSASAVPRWVQTGNKLCYCYWEYLFVRVRNCWKCIFNWKIFDIFLPGTTYVLKLLQCAKIGFNILWELKRILIWRLAFEARCSYKKRLTFCKMYNFSKNHYLSFQWYWKKIVTVIWFFISTKAICWFEPLRDSSWQESIGFYLKMTFISLYLRFFAFPSTYWFYWFNHSFIHSCHIYWASNMCSPLVKRAQFYLFLRTNLQILWQLLWNSCLPS